MGVPGYVVYSFEGCQLTHWVSGKHVVFAFSCHPATLEMFNQCFRQLFLGGQYDPCMVWTVNL